ncbi:MAG: hypothetical protein AAB851_02945 [Patescibacteria group bacterium]
MDNNGGSLRDISIILLDDREVYISLGENVTVIISDKVKVKVNGKKNRGKKTGKKVKPYYCTECDLEHNPNTKIGKDHLEYKDEDDDEEDED